MSPTLKTALAALFAKSPMGTALGLFDDDCAFCCHFNLNHDDDCSFDLARTAFEVECGVFNLEQRLIERLNTKECALEYDAMSGMDINDALSKGENKMKTMGFKMRLNGKLYDIDLFDIKPQTMEEKRAEIESHCIEYGIKIVEDNGEFYAVFPAAKGDAAIETTEERCRNEIFAILFAADDKDGNE